MTTVEKQAPWKIETPRLGLREITRADFHALCAILQDPETMYAWGHGFSIAEVRDWIAENLRRYQSDGFSFYAAIEKETGELVGAIGPLIETIDGQRLQGIAYIVKRAHWRRGFAWEGAGACLQYAFDTLGASNVIAEVRPENLASRKVAEKLGMRVVGTFTKRYHGKEMPHLIYQAKKP